MANNMQAKGETSPFQCHLFHSQAIDKLVAFIAHIFVFSFCPVVTAFLTGQNEIVNNQVQRMDLPRGTKHLLVALCSGIVSPVIPHWYHTTLITSMVV
jgi:hypothetical protein